MTTDIAVRHKQMLMGYKMVARLGVDFIFTSLPPPHPYITDLGRI
jgi:hypothetical protein